MTDFPSYLNPNCPEFYALKQWSNYQSYICDNLVARTAALDGDYSKCLNVGNKYVAARICDNHNAVVLRLQYPSPAFPPPPTKADSCP